VKRKSAYFVDLPAELGGKVKTLYLLALSEKISAKKQVNVLTV